jgi:hypothetical protein
MAAEPLLHGRYQLLRLLGQGSMGVVYLAHDSVLDRELALKTMRSLGPEDIYRLKREFRSLAEVAHPHLVQLYDLVASDDDCFFTMEWVRGATFVDAFVGSDGASRRVDQARLEEGIRQLCSGLLALHGRQKLHRDIKPTNVLVEPSGRLVLIDFGLVSDEGALALRSSRSTDLGGTPVYMAPEQLCGEGVSPASDWYAVGVMLYEALTGQAPFEGLGPNWIFDRTSKAPPSPSELAPETPDHLDALVMALLRRNPSERPTPSEILARLERKRDEATPRVHAAEVTTKTHLIGRTREREELEAAFRRRDELAWEIVEVEGSSGIGKTALIEDFLIGLERRRQAVVLRARCHPHESLPFKALDQAIDDLARYLAGQSPEGLAAVLPRHSHVLPRLFPVLGRVCPGSVAVDGEPHEIRRRAFAAFRELLGRLGDRQPTVLWIDDVQWGDLDSAALLRELLRPPDPPRVLLIISHRSDESEGASVIRAMAASGEHDASPERRVKRIVLGPLSKQESRQLATELLAGLQRDEGVAEAIAMESAGNPFLLGQLVQELTGRPDADEGRLPAPSLERVVEARLERLPRSARHLLDLVALAGEPISERLLFCITPPVSEAFEGLKLLRSGCLLRTASRGGEPALDTFHDRIRETAVSLLGEEELRALHREIAERLEAQPGADPHQLVRHYRRAGDAERAGEYAFGAAERAVGVMAFESAALLYREALDLGVSSCPIGHVRARLGEALVSAGRGSEGAAHLEAAAHDLEERQEGIEALRLKRRAAEHYLRSGLHMKGIALLREVLDATQLSYARTPVTAALAVVVNRLRLRVQRSFGSVSRDVALAPFERERLETCWAAGVGLSLHDQMRAADFQVRHALLALRAGDPGHLSRALATEGFLLAWEGGVRKRRRSQRLRREGERLAREAAQPDVRVHSLLMSASAAYYEMRLREGLALCEQAERLCRESCSAAAWELTNTQVLTGNTLARLGELARLRVHVPEVLQRARERNDYHCLVTARLGYAVLAWLAADRSDEARQQVTEALAGPFPSSYTWQVYQGALALALVDLYDGAAADAWKQMREAWATLRSRQLLRFQYTRVEMRHLLATCALANAAREQGLARRRLIAFAARAARQIAAEDAQWVDPFAQSLRGGVHALRGERSAAIRSLQGAALGFEELSMPLHASAHLHRAGELLGDAAGLALRSEQEASLRVRGVGNPGRLVRSLAAGGAA